VPISFRLRKATKTASGPVGPYLTHSGVKNNLNHLWASQAVIISFRRRRVTQDTFRPLGLRLPHSSVEPTKTTSGPVELCQTHSGVEKLSRPLQGRSGRFYLIPATKGLPDRFWAGRTVPISLRRRRVTQNTFRLVGLSLPHSGVKGSPKTLLGHSGCVYLIPASKATKATSGPLGLCLSHSCVEGHPKHF
jgi:hypothetical protein